MQRTKWAVLLYGFIIGVAAGSLKLNRRAHRQIMSLIVDGPTVPHDKYPFVVSLENWWDLDDEWVTTCGGSIVNRKTVLTACHCVSWDQEINGPIKRLADPKTLRVVAGTANWSQNTPTRQTAKVDRLVPHPKCENTGDKSYYNDVALVFLKTSLVYSQQVAPMQLPTTTEYLKELESQKAKCTTVGWGTTNSSDPFHEQSKVLRLANMIMLAPEKCHKLFCKKNMGECYDDFKALGQICAVSAASSDCFGDSGGPLVCNGYVVGTVSYGAGSCRPKVPTVYQGLQPILDVLAVNEIVLDPAQ